MASQSEILIDLKQLVKTATEDFDKQRFISYRHYIDEFNRLLAEAQKIDPSITMNLIAEVPQEQRAWMGVGFSFAEQAKLREVANAAERLYERMQDRSPTSQWPEDPINIALQPWPVISTHLFDLSSDEIVDIIASTGLQVNWSLTKEESYSHTTRKRAYRPRVDTAYAGLQEDDKLRVAWIVTSEILRIKPTLEHEISKSLDRIGWKIVSGALQPARVEVSEIFFSKGSVHDAYVQIRAILQSASKSLIIIDPYLESSIFALLSTVDNHSLEVKLLGFKFPPDFVKEADLFQKQYGHITILARQSREFHDRFIIVDGTRCFHIGASIKDAGLKVFMINQIEDAENAGLLIEQQQNSWNSATVVI